MTDRPRLPDGQECALRIARLVELRGEESPVTRVQLSERTVRRVCGRVRISRELMDEIQEWLWRGGWTLFRARTTYAMIRTGAVLSWARVSSRRLDEDIDQNGSFDVERHLHLIEGGDQRGDD